MATRAVLDVVVNKLTKAEYDEYVADGTITQQEIDDQVWIFTDDQFLSAQNLAKLVGIAAGAEVNVIDGVTVNGATVTPSGKVVNIVVPTKTSDLTNDSGFITEGNIPTKLSDLTNDLDMSAYANKIESVKVNGEAVTPGADKSVDITVPTCKVRIWG